MMGKEIEKKYVLHTYPTDLDIVETQEIHQTYLATSESETLRVRKLVINGQEQFTMTHKAGKGLVREETEFDIGAGIYEQLIGKLEVTPLIKTRKKVKWNDYHFDLDIYHNTVQKNLITIEIEFAEEADVEHFQKPDWFGEDVTGESQYVNSVLWEHIQSAAK